MAKKLPQPTHPWAQEPEELLKNFDTSITKGLSSAKAKEKLAEEGLNEIARKGQKPAYVILLEQFLNPLVLVLIVASIISFFLGEQTDAIIIIGIVIFNAVMGFVQEFGAEKTVRALSKLISRKAKVLRDSKKVEIDAKYIVRGDIVYLSIGDIIPADIRILHQDEMTIDESSLTGESVPVMKTTNITPTERTLPQYLKNIAFMGTHVMSGDGYGVVINTGEKTYFGKTASYLKSAETISDFEKSISSFSRFLLKIIIVMTIVIFGINAFLQHGLFDSFLFALALAVGITPEALPVIITISLSKGAQNLAKTKVIIKKLSSIEDLGNMDVLCTDKTGTLTEGKLSLENYINSNEEKDSQLLVYGMLCNSAIVGKKKVEGNMIDRAIWETPDKKKVMADFKKYKIIDNNEFDFERRRMSVLVSGPDKKRTLVVKGGLESLESVCDKIVLKGKVVPFNKANFSLFKKTTDKYRLQGYTTICLATKELKGDKSNKKDETVLTLVGFLIFLDPPRKSAKVALEKMKVLGVDIKVLSGDDPLVTEAICKKVGLQIKGGKILTGDDLDKLNDKSFAEAAEKYNVFSRVSPEHKYRLVKILNSGPTRTVAFMGDGINDAPAIKIADVGISVNTATDIAKEAADIILMQKSLNVVVEGIIEGRKIFTNITKYILNTVSANYGNMFTVAGSSLFLKFIPLLPAQILLNNLITDTPMVAIATDNIDEDQLKKPKKLDIAMIRHFMIFFGLLSTIFDMTLILTLLFIFKAEPTLFRTAWFFESALSEVLVTFSIRTRKMFFMSKPGTVLLSISLAVAALLFVLVLTPLGSLFELTILPTNIILFVLGIIACYFISAEIAKKFFFKKYQY